MSGTVGETEATETQLEAFLGRARAFFDDLDIRLRRQPATFEWGRGDDRVVAIWEEEDEADQMAQLEASRAYRQQRFDAGFGWIDGPEEVGGQGLPASFRKAFDKLEAQYDVPDQTFFKLDRVIAPILRQYGTPEVVRQYVRALYRGDVVGCELFSEPGAGSDLASLSTRAEVQDGAWLINGQKVWTSDAHYADIGLALCRTDRSMSGRRGLSLIVVDMRQPGVLVRPLRQMTGGSSFNEVFLTDVASPADHLLGEEGDGWRIAQELLRYERNAIGTGLSRGGAGIANGERLIALVKEMGRSDDPIVRQELARVYTNFRVTKSMGRLAQDRVRAGQSPGAIPVLTKLALSRNMAGVNTLVEEVLGPRLVANTGEWGTFAWSLFVLGEPGIHITAGTDEVMRNVVARRFLDMPPEPDAHPRNSDGRGAS